MAERVLSMYNVPALGRVEIVAEGDGARTYKNFKGKINGQYVTGACSNDLEAKSEVILKGYEIIGSRIKELNQGEENWEEMAKIDDGITIMSNLNDEVYEIFTKTKLGETP